EYNSRVVTTDSRIGNHLWHNSSPQYMSTEKTLVWDSTQPIPVYREEPVMSLTDLMVYTGGLFGLWFGTNIKDVIIWFIDSRLWIWDNELALGIINSIVLIIQFVILLTTVTPEGWARVGTTINNSLNRPFGIYDDRPYASYAYQSL
ncbi:unnamed protein product, partial [Oppiella nova]